MAPSTPPRDGTVPEAPRFYPALLFPTFPYQFGAFTDYAVQAHRYYGDLEYDEDPNSFIQRKGRERRKLDTTQYDELQERMRLQKQAAIDTAAQAHPHALAVISAAEANWNRKIDWAVALRAAEYGGVLYAVLAKRLKLLTETLHALVGLVDRMYTDDLVKKYVRLEYNHYRADMPRVERLVKYCRQVFYRPPLPARVDGKLKILENALPGIKVHRFSRSRFDHDPQYQPDPLGHTGAWEGAWKLGQGGYGTVALWVRSNNGTIDKICACKDTFMSRHDWFNATKWERHSVNADRVPTEIHCNQLLRNSGLVPNMNRHYVDKFHKQYIMYLDYCSFGDLSKLKHTYLMLGTGEKIPEPFLWRTFLSLAQVGFLMEYGHQMYHRPEAKAGWKPIIHRDLKPANVFLTTPRPSDFPLYPMPQLGDFGLAIRVEKEDHRNPEMYLDTAGTRGYYAPEQRAYVDYASNEPVDREKLTAQTNVWGFGKIMYSITALDQDEYQPDFLGNPNSDGLDIRLQYPHLTTGPSPYSTELLGLINECLRQNPYHRPASWQLVKRITREIEKKEETSEMRDAEGMNGIAPDDPRRLLLKHSEYRVGMARRQLRDPDLI